MRLIDADPLIEEIASIYDFSISAVRCSLVGSVIANAPTINIPHSDDWEKYSDKLWKNAYERGKADRLQGEWIPCSERLPEYRELVNVTTRDLRVKLAYLDSIQEDGTDDFWTMPLDDANCALWNIVAWMPLPEPWKGADDAQQ